MKSDQMGTRTAHPSPQELLLSNWTRFSLFILVGPAGMAESRVTRPSGVALEGPAFFLWVLPTLWRLVDGRLASDHYRKCPPRRAGLCAPLGGPSEPVPSQPLLACHRLNRERESGEGRDQDEQRRRGHDGILRARAT
jgi:hypothetical protein